MASVWISSSVNAFMSFSAASARPWLSRMSDGLVQGVEDDAKAFQDVDAFAELLQFEFEAFADREQAEIEEMAQHLLQAQPVRLRLCRRRPAPGRSC